MLHALVILFFLLPGILCAEIIETFYGDLDVQEPVILELIKSPTFQRLKKIHQYGVSYYSGTHTEEYTRYDHSVGVFAILRLKGLSLQEQVAGLLHDVSHTVFSHVGDWVYAKEHHDKDHQNDIHITFLERCELAGILKKHGYTPENILPVQTKFPALECPLPDLSADRIEYNIQGAFHRGYISQEEGRKLLNQLEFVDGKWVCHNPEVLAKVVRFSLFMTRACWGSPENDIRSGWLADALILGVEKGLFSEDDIHYGTDEEIWQRLCSSKEPGIVKRIQALKLNKRPFRILDPSRKGDRLIRSKFRGIDPLILHQGKCKRLTDVHPEIARIFAEKKAEMHAGWAITFDEKELAHRYEGGPLGNWKERKERSYK